MIPGVLDLEIYQGDRYELFFLVRDEILDPVTQQWIADEYVDLTGYIARSQIRDPQGAVVAEFTCTVVDQTAARGGVLCVLIPAQTKLLVTDVKYVWDVELESPEGPEYVETYLAGKVTVTNEVTYVDTP